MGKELCVYSLFAVCGDPLSNVDGSLGEGALFCRLIDEYPPVDGCGSVQTVRTAAAWFLEPIF